ncbi:expressed unknown protein [Seminavis robusta]|uniref:Uncharacterized protein n=1 Tax=Seminavis robusta TaxID=568900 RepID=A0A9N8H7T3_9STRA|nr:expressed unknown protein [Seminavis robusta]|eukprot:Sro138_g064860.1 n/a (107) ;mRNA; f:89717-90037
MLLVQQEEEEGQEENVCLEKPDAFISHAHDLLFEDLISALAWHFRNEANAYVWLDLFSINQHETMEWTFEWLTSTFRNNLAEINRTVYGHESMEQSTSVYSRLVRI